MKIFHRCRRGMSSHDTGSTIMKKIVKVTVGKSMGARPVSRGRSGLPGDTAYLEIRATGDPAPRGNQPALGFLPWLALLRRALSLRFFVFLDTRASWSWRDEHRG